MEIEDFRTLYTYNLKFVPTVIDSLKQVDWDRIVNERVCGWGSVRNLIVHTVGAEEFWFSKVLQGGQHETLTEASFNSAEELGKRWEEVIGKSIDYIDTLSKEDLSENRNVRWETGELTCRVEEILIHVYTHTVHHRGQMVMAIRQMGGEPSEIDIL
ncbi:MAG: DUF664 domain-containing protein [candidate division Zixibacteria bacterium]|nr:DUF664 domain-containing protein [candidate division Zixibacteria bacterium]